MMKRVCVCVRACKCTAETTNKHCILYFLLIDGDTDTSVIQDFVFNLGQVNTRNINSKSRMATICKVTRSQIPPTFTSVSDCFSYAFANPDLRGKYTYTYLTLTLT